MAIVDLLIHEQRCIWKSFPLHLRPRSVARKLTNILLGINCSNLVSLLLSVLFYILVTLHKAAMTSFWLCDFLYGTLNESPKFVTQCWESALVGSIL